ncbi:uncharacterized protein LOC127757062 [Oryza glaberrima]|uniref:DUF1618 domain-containing protein n=1 Tax=Oryza glaberrima TaxID=4538 RepID=I1NK78_ORYGL|nr:uncharacterized protein LOC127757062 [Oryza glaberrima]
MDQMAERQHKKRKPEKMAGARTSGHDKEEEKKVKAPSVYLVVGHEVSWATYSVFKVDPYAAAKRGGGGGDEEDPAPVPIPRRLARISAKFCMSFAPVPVRSWIVGVGGDSADEDYAPETIVFDTETRAVIRGPNLLSTKLHPVVLTIGHKIYALARYPSVTGQLDFVPWFEVLDLSQARVVDGHLESCEWKPLPRPPFFPWDLTPLQYLSPPMVTVESYVALASCILVSLSQQEGTHMFDVEKEQWSKLDDNSLPFVRGAVPHGPIFLGLSRAKKTITAYNITVVCQPRSGGTAPSLSIVEFPVVSDREEEILSTPIFLSLGSPGFCSLKSWSDHPTTDDPCTRARIKLMAYHTEEPISQECIESSHGLLIPNQWKQVYEICDSSRELIWQCLITAMSL